MKKIVRLLYVFPGLVLKLLELSLEGSRDISNKVRFKKAILDKGSSFNENTILKDYARVLGKSIINNSTIESYSYIGRNCLIQNAKIGKFCSIANDVLIGLGTHPLDHFTTSPLFYRKSNTFGKQIVDENLDFEEYKDIIIKNDVWIGAKVTVLDGVEIGNGAVVATGSVVTKNVPDYAIVAGIPAKVIKYRFDKSKIDQLLASKWWEKEIVEIKDSSKELNQIK